MLHFSPHMADGPILSRIPHYGVCIVIRRSGHPRSQETGRETSGVCTGDTQGHALTPKFCLTSKLAALFMHKNARSIAWLLLYSSFMLNWIFVF